MFICVQPSLSDSEDLEEMERLRKEHIEALREIKRLQVKQLHQFPLFKVKVVIQIEKFDSTLLHKEYFLICVYFLLTCVHFLLIPCMWLTVQEQLVESQRVHHQMEEELSKVKQVSHTHCRYMNVNLSQSALIVMLCDCWHVVAFEQ